MRLKWILACALFLTAACGGGGGSSPALESAALHGLVYEVDGQTQDRSGIRVTLLETGEARTTGDDGRFDFQIAPGSTATLAFGRTGAFLAGNDDNDNSGPGGDDDNGDDNDNSGPGGGGDNSGPGGDDDGGDESEDDDGNPRIPCAAGDSIEVRCAIEGDDVSEFSASCRDRRRAEARLSRAPDSPDADVEGEVEVESRVDREEFELEVEHLAPGTVVEILLDDPSDDAPFVSLGLIAAGDDGEAELELETNDGDRLPLGASGAADLAGFLVEVRTATGELLLTGEVPALPDGMPALDDAPAPGGRGRGRTRLLAHVSGLEGDVEIRSRPEDNRQRFDMEAEHLTPGTRVAFLIEDPDNPGTFVRLASATADAEGEAEISTQDGLPMPHGVGDVAELVGLEVQVIRDDGTEALLLSGTVPPLVAD